MASRTSEAGWRGDLKDGQGEIKLGSGAFSGSYSYHSRFEDGAGTNPEELIAAAHAGCFSMALAAALAAAGHPPAKIHTTAKVHFGIDATAFERTAAEAKQNCPVSKALKAVEITLAARLV